MSNNPWENAPFVVEEFDGFRVVRDDLLEGGTKLRFLPELCAGNDHIVYASPFCGGAQVALSVMGRELKKQITIFTAARKKLHPNQITAMGNGASLVQVPVGYLSVCMARAREFAQIKKALLLPMGFNTAQAQRALIVHLLRLRAQLGKQIPKTIWCASGSSMLSTSLAIAFPNTTINAVMVGGNLGPALQPGNIKKWASSLKFERPLKMTAPFPSNGNYDLKAWALMKVHEVPRRDVLFWNVMG